MLVLLILVLSLGVGANAQPLYFPPVSGDV